MDEIRMEPVDREDCMEEDKSPGAEHLVPAPNDLIKLVAVLSMLVDHIGMVFFPQVAILRLLGRVAFPLFAYQLGISWRCTRSKPKLALRLLIFGLLAQPAFYALTGNWNVMFTLLYCLGMFWIMDRWGTPGKILAFALAAASYKLSFLDCALFGPVCAFGYYAFPMYQKDDKMLLGFAYQGLTTYLICVFLDARLQIYQLAALIFILYPFRKQIKIPKYFFYIFYPAHLTLFWGLWQLIK